MATSDGPRAWADIVEVLGRPFDDVKQRVGATTKKRDRETGLYPAGTRAQMLSYIDARQAFDRLDEAAGPAWWHEEFRVLDLEAHAVECRLTITGLVDGQPVTVTRSDVGYPNGPDSPEPLKDAYSDALKRAAVHFGMGRYLYGLEAEWVDVDAHGRPVVARKTERTGPTDKQRALIFALLKEKGLSKDEGQALLASVTGKEHTHDLTAEEASHFIEALRSVEPVPEQRGLL